MSAVQDTRDARNRAQRLLTEIASGAIVLTPRTDWPYARSVPGTVCLVAPLDEDEQHAMADLDRLGLILIEDGAEHHRPVALTDKGRAVLGVPPAGPAPPPLLCDGVIHAQGEQPPAVVVVAETTGELKRMVLCRDCGQRYALDAACLALAGFELDPSAPPVAIHLIRLPQAVRRG